MDDILENLAKLILNVFRGLVVLVWSATEYVYDKILWYIGWPVLRLVSLGNYPKQGFLDSDSASRSDHFIVGLVGIIFPIMGLYLIAKAMGL